MNLLRPEVPLWVAYLARSPLTLFPSSPFLKIWTRRVSSSNEPDMTTDRVSH